MSVTSRNIDPLTARDVSQLVQVAAWPSVTILLDTTPADRMQPCDAIRLEELLQDAERQLAAKGAHGSHRLRNELRSLARDAAANATESGLALFASQAVHRSYRLPNAVGPRVVVEHTFRTRDLLRSLHRTPPHLLLMLHATCAQLYRVYGDTLEPLPQSPFPIQLTVPVRGHLQDGADVLPGFLHTVDRQLSHTRARHPAPIILAGDSEPVTRLVRHSRHLHRLAGVLTGPEVADPTVLHLAAKASLEEYLRSRQDEALLLLEEAQRHRPSTVFSGIEACWHRANGLRPTMLIVEESHHFPAVVDNQGVHPADPRNEPVDAPPGTRSDLVDDLIEVVIDRGGWVAFADDGALSAHDKVALVTRQ